MCLCVVGVAMGLVGSFLWGSVCVRENVCVCAVGVVTGLFAGLCV